MTAWALFFVFGVALNCMAVWGAPSPWYSRAGWACWLIAALLWLLAPETAVGHLSYR